MILKKERQANRFIVLLVLFIIMVSCSDKRDFETYIGYTGIDFVDQYEIDSIDQVGFSDWSLVASIVISENDKIRILDHLKENSDFPVVKSKNDYIENYHTEKSNITGYIIGQKYFYELFKPRNEIIKGENDFAGYEIFAVEIDTLTNKLFFDYLYE